MNTYKLLALIAGSILIGIGLYTLTRKKDDAKDSAKKIAIFTPISHEALEEIEHDFKETMLKNNPDAFEFITFNANGNKTLQRAQAEEIINNKYDLIFTIGSSCSQLVAELAKKKGAITPQVFCAVEDPVGMGIANSLDKPGNNITGVIEGSPNLAEQVRIMRMLKPDTKNVVLVYDPGVKFTNEKTKQELEEVLAKNGIQLHSIEISNANEIQQKVAGLLPDKDFVFVLKDNTVVAGIDGLVTLCNRYGVPLFVSDLNSGKKGAAIAYGIREGDSGVFAAQKALQVLLNGNKAGQTPITTIEKLNLAINKTVLEQQKLFIDPKLLATIEQTSSIE